MAFERPLRATRHCRHYSYITPITRPDSGPHCAAGIDLSGAGLLTGPCMPDATTPCAKREDYTEAERAAWKKATDERIDLGLPTYGSGLLGASGRTPAEAEGMRLITIERRILRIERTLRRAGIEVEMTPFPGGRP